MAESIGRLGYLGLAVETTAGTPEGTPDVFIPFTENSLRGMHEPLMDIAARTSRVMNNTSVEGKKWGEGQVTMYLDSLVSPYLFKLALGQESRTQRSSTPPVHDHLFYPTVSGNAATAATLWNSRQVDCERFAYSVVDSLEVTVGTDGIATVSASFMSQSPTTVTAPSLVTASGTLYTWKDMSAKFGATVAEARVATPTKLTNFQFSINNNVEVNYKSGSSSPDTLTYGAVEVSGTYTLFFENATDRDAHKNLTKRSLVVDLTGAGLGTGGFTEKMTFEFERIMLEDTDFDTGLDDLFTITGSFRAEVNQANSGYFSVIARNGKATDYGA